jgi:hypothetical protein
MLRPEFAGVGCVAQATSGAGVKPGIRARLWYLLDRPISDGEARRWLAGAPVDHSIFRAVQPIYTAAPVLRGVADPMQWRLCLVPGPRVTVPELPEPPAPTPLTRREPGYATGPHYALAALEAECRAVVAAGVGGRHEALNRAAFKLARFVASGELSEGEVALCLIAAARDAGITDGERELCRFLACGVAAGLRKYSHAR